MVALGILSVLSLAGSLSGLSGFGRAPGAGSGQRALGALPSDPSAVVYRDAKLVSVARHLQGSWIAANGPSRRVTTTVTVDGNDVTRTLSICRAHASSSTRATGDVGPNSFGTVVVRWEQEKAQISTVAVDPSNTEAMTLNGEYYYRLGSPRATSDLALHKRVCDRASRRESRARPSIGELPRWEGLRPRTEERVTVVG